MPDHRILRVAAAAFAVFGIATCAAAAVVPPANVVGAGKIVFCSDLTFPPLESLQGSRPVGAEVDIGSAVARLMRVKAEFRNIGFEGLIAALEAKKCDAILSGMTDTADRRKEVHFTDYLDVGMSIMVAKGNPDRITGLASLAGRDVAVPIGSIEGGVLAAENKRLTLQHLQRIGIKVFNTNSDAAEALLTGRVDAFFSDDPPIGYYVKQSGGKFATAVSRIDAAPYGIATRRSDPLGGALGKTVAELYANGTMKSILGKWGLSAVALEQ
jgi:polar amino acid transport system substrate-binding protein